MEGEEIRGMSVAEERESEGESEMGRSTKSLMFFAKHGLGIIGTRIFDVVPSLHP